MYVNEYLDLLKGAEIKKLSFFDYGKDAVTPTVKQLASRSTLVGFINMANLEIHKRFQILQKELVFNLGSGSRVFDLPLDYLYVVDAAFEDGTPISINNENVEIRDGIDYNVSLMFPAPFKLIIKGIDEDRRGRVSLIYIASPPKVETITDFMELPEAFTEALVNYVAYRCHLSISAKAEDENNSFFARFEASIRTVKQLGLGTQDDLSHSNNLFTRGFI
jgi:hypothetical protein